MRLRFPVEDLFSLYPIVSTLLRTKVKGQQQTLREHRQGMLIVVRSSFTGLK